MLIDLNTIIKENELVQLQDKFLLAVSGGADSIFLFHQFLSSDVEFEVAHCNFQLRGADSDEDEKFVQNLCKVHNTPFHSIKFDTESLAAKEKKSIQITARDLRYNWFKKLLKERNLKLIVTAHHLDDRIETFFLNLFRGTGLKGLSPIPLIHENKFRPLIHTKKSEILDYLKSNEISFREDQSNSDDKYQRNNIRLNTLPAIEEKFPDYRSRFQENFERLELTNHYIEEQGKLFISSSLIQQGEDYSIDLGDLNSDQQKLWLIERFGGHFSHLKELKKLILSQKGKKFVLGNHILIREESELFIQRLDKQEERVNFQINSIPFENEILICHLADQIETYQKNSIYLDSEKIRFPIIIRNWRIGDRFQPLGMKGKKLMSDYLKDRKIPNHKRSSILVAESNNEILGVLGFSCSETMKVNRENCNTLIIKLKEI